jgi:hypothetical protein
MAKSYERLREQVLRDGGSRCIAAAVVQRQGVWAWMLFVSSATDGSAPSRPVHPSSILSPPPPPIRSELVAVWTDLVLGTVARQEVL